MQKLVVALVAIALLAAGVITAVLSSSSGQVTDVAEAETSEAFPYVSPPPAELQAPDDGEPTSAPEPATDTRQEVEAEVEADEAEPLPAIAPDSSRVVDVRIAFPDGAPADDRLVVLVLSGERSFDGLYGRRGIVPERQRLARDTSYRGLVNVVPVDVSGRAHVIVPEELDVAHLAVSGRYLYSGDGTTEIAADVTSIDLSPQLGAYATGNVLPPLGYTAADFPDDVEVSLRTDLANRTSWGGSGDPLRLQHDVAVGERFEFFAVPTGSTLTIATESEDLAVLFEEGLAFEGGKRLDKDLQLSLGGNIRGLVVDEQGNPVVNADVEARTRDFWGNPAFDIREAETGEDGTYELVAVRAGKVWITVEHDDFRYYRSEATELGEGKVLEHGEILLSTGGRLAGTVMFPDGSPAAGTEVELGVDLSANVDGSPVDRTTISGVGKQETTDATGAFSFQGLGEGPFSVEATLELSVEQSGERAPGRWTTRVIQLSPEVGAGPEMNINVVLEAPLSLAGHVSDGDGTPVTEFEVVANRESQQWYLPPSATERDEFESEEGAFTLTNLTAGKWKIHAIAGGFAPGEPIEVTLPTEEALELRLERPVTIVGRVIDPDGRPVASAEVAPEMEMLEMVRRGTGAADERPMTFTDATGGFELTGLKPGQGNLVASKEGFAPSTTFSFEVEAGEKIEDALLELRVGGRITGEVFGDDGEHAPGATVIIQRVGTLRRETLQTDEDGKFELANLAPERWQVMSMRSDVGGNRAELLKSLKMKMVELEDGGEEHVVLGAPPENPVRIKGTVTAAGRPISDTVVSFIPVEGGGMDNLKLLTLDDEGRYETVLEEPGDYLVTLQYMAQMGQQHSIEYRERIPEREEYELDFELPLGKISGRVAGPDGGPADNARVTLNISGGVQFGTAFGGQYTETTTNEDGVYELPFLRPGAYRVAAGGSILGGMLGEQARGGRQVTTVDVREGQWVRGIDFSLDEPGSIKGVVRDHAGSPVAKSFIYVRDETGNLLEVFAIVQTDSGGRFTYEGLAPGRYTVSARSDQLASSGDQQVRVESGAEAGVELVMDPGTILVVTLQDNSGELVPATVSVVDSRGRELSGMIGLEQLMDRYSGGLGSGDQRIGPLPPGTYVVRATTSDGRSTKKKVTLGGQEERKLRLRLK